MDRRTSRWEKTRQDQPQRREEGRAKTEEGEKKKRGEEGVLAGSQGRECATDVPPPPRGGMC